MLPLGAGEGAVGNKAGIGAPGTGVGAIGIGGLDLSLIHREEGGEGSQTQEVGAGSNQLHLQGVVIHSLHADQNVVGFHGGGGGSLVRIVALVIGGQSLVEGDQAVVQVAVVRGGQGVGGTVPAVNEIVGSQGLAVAPLGLLQLEGVGQAVLRHLRHLGGHIRLQLAFGVVAQQAGERVDSQAGAVNGGVEGGVQVVRLGSQVDVQGGGVGVERCSGSAGGLAGSALGSGLRGGSAAGAGGGTAGSQRQHHRSGQNRCHELFHVFSLHRDFYAYHFHAPTQFLYRCTKTG